MVIWLCGMSAAGKTTIGTRLAELVRETLPNIVYLDGDVLRDVWGDHLGHTLEDRRFNCSRISHLCKMLDDQGIHVVAAVLYPFNEWMEWNRANFSSFFEVFLDVPQSVLEARDPKGLYAKAHRGEMKNVVGVDIPFIRPVNPDLVIENGDPPRPPQDLAREILAASRLSEYIPRPLEGASS